MSFASVLFDDASKRPGDEVPQPDFFTDLNLDQIVAAVTANRDEYRLAPFFSAACTRAETVIYRQQVFQDLRDQRVRAGVVRFGTQLRGVRSLLRALSGGSGFPRQRQRWRADAATLYVEAVSRLAEHLGGCELGSRALRGLRDYLDDSVASASFGALRDDAAAVIAGLDAIRYCVRVRGARVTVSRYAGEADYSAHVLTVFDRFRQNEVEVDREAPPPVGLDHVGAAVLDLVARLFPAPFSALARFDAEHRDVVDPVVAAFDREVQFYLAYLEHIEKLESAGLSFCFPEVVSGEVGVAPVRVEAIEAFDLALAARLVAAGRPVVPNDLLLTGPERVGVVTGPNQGGKTTFARMVGQVHHLARLGCPVPGRRARLPLCDQIFTHFERREDATALRGKLADDLMRMRAILDRVTPRGLVVMNEVFTSTSLADALLLGERVLRRLIAADALGVCVTFVDEWSRLGPATVSFVSDVDPVDPSLRTFRIARREADGQAYAVSLADKYGLGYQRVRERIHS